MNNFQEEDKFIGCKTKVKETIKYDSFHFNIPKTIQSDKINGHRIFMYGKKLVMLVLKFTRKYFVKQYR